MNQKGFSLPHLLLGLVAVAIIGFAGWRVYEAQKDTNQSLDNASNANEVVKPEEKKEEYKIPEGYRVHEEKQHGFSLAYPEALGDMHAAITAEEPNVIMRIATKGRATYPIAGMQGFLAVTLEKKEGFKVTTGKYGSTISPVVSGNTVTWKVVEKNPASVESHKIGDEYKPKLTTNAQGVQVYDISYTDEGCMRSGWFFESKSGYVVVYAPSLCQPGAEGLGAEIDQQYKEQYKQFSDNVMNSFKVL